MQIIPLHPEDDIISICDRLDWADEQQVLLVLPEDGGVLREGLDLVRLRRHADNLRLEAGLVTADIEVTRQAQALGVPTFTSVGLARRSRRGWWRGRQQREQVGLSLADQGSLAQKRPYPTLDPGDKAEAQRRLAPLPTTRAWLLRYAAILLFFMTLSVLYVAFTYTVPGATIILHPETQTIQAEQPIVADPELAGVDYVRNQVPGRVLHTTQSWQTSVDASGAVEVPDAPARGSVLFVNQLAQPVTVPAGTRVSTSDGSNVTFQTVEEVTLGEAVGSTAEVDVIAEEPGPEGNVAANRVNRVAGSLALQVEVRNLEPLEGGGVRQAPAVTEADRERLRAQVVQFLQAVALSELETQLTEREFLAPDSLRLVTILDETYSHEVGEQTSRLTLAMRAEIEGTAVNTTEASGLAYQALAQEVPVGFTLVPDRIRFESGNVVGVDEAGRVTFSMIAEGVVAANLRLNEVVEAITGQEKETAVAYLYQQLPLREAPSVDVWPLWFDRIPYLTSRIQTEIDP